MPTYQYRCRTCGHELEAQQSFTDAPLTECPECAGSLRKVFSAVGISFKGSGFYTNDARAGSSSGSEPSGGSSGSESSGSSDTASSGSSSSGSESGSGSSSSGSSSGSSGSGSSSSASAA